MFFRAIIFAFVGSDALAYYVCAILFLFVLVRDVLVVLPPTMGIRFLGG